MTLVKRREANPVVPSVEKILDVDASMQGTVAFRDPVNLRINGRFEGKLETRGNLTIGEQADVKATILGDQIVVAGHVEGDIEARESLSLVAPAMVLGTIVAPTLSVAPGAVFHGTCRMLQEESGTSRLNNTSATASSAGMSLDEVAKFLEVDPDTILQWAGEGRIPALRHGSAWQFERAKVEAWLASEKAK